MEISVERAREAWKARLAATDQALGEAYLESQWDELKASMVAVSAAAHAIDAFDGTVSKHIPLPDGLWESWEKNGTSRRDRILETLKIGFDIGPRIEQWTEDLAWLFDLRDSAVHHQSEAKPVGNHPGGHLMVPQESIDYTQEAAIRVRDIGTDVITTCLRAPKAKHRDLQAWATEERFRADQLEELRDPGGVLRRWGPGE